jgi:hypothetical protein
MRPLADHLKALFVRNKKIDSREKQYLEYLSSFHREYKLNGDYAYLEIGVQRFLSFDLSQASLNIGIDPVFKSRKYSNSNRKVEIFVRSMSQNFFSDCIFKDIRDSFQKISRKVFFIDGDHSATGVLADIMGCIALAKISEDAVIFVHDVLPKSEKEIYRDSKYYVGDGFRTIMALTSYTDELRVLDLDPSGLGVIDHGAIRKLADIPYSDLENQLRNFESLSVADYLSEVKITKPGKFE